jgi:hypothetical protein
VKLTLVSAYLSVAFRESRACRREREGHDNLPSSTSTPYPRGCCMELGFSSLGCLQKKARYGDAKPFKGMGGGADSDLHDPRSWLAVESKGYEVFAAAVLRCGMLAVVGLIACGVGALALWGVNALA